jgi:nitrogen-specific signal transduction histidine kinase
VARDVTARVRLEEELRHAQRMEAVGRLAGGVAHDFNNLLTVIISYSELLTAQLSHDPRLSRDVQEIRHAADRAAALTRQLLSFSRRQVLQPAALDINDVVRDTEGLLRRLIGPEIEIVARIDPAAGMVFVDKGQLEQVIVNLVVNARDAMLDGGVLTVETQLVRAIDAPASARAHTNADHFAAIVVRDTGAGMDEATLSRIFDPFFTTKEIGRGTGLGLSTVHGILEQSGGAVTVESRVGIGSEFRILLPSFGAVHASAAEAPPPDTRLALRRPTHAQRRVLLVEDDAAVRAGLRRMLDAAGYDVVEAVDGAAALDALQRTAPHVNVVLSDVAMPSLDGRALARELRARWPALPLILMSGFADRAAFSELPGLVVLQKPLAADALVSAIETAVSPPRPVA